MADSVSLDRQDVLRALRYLVMIGTSLDRIGSAAADMTKEEYDRVSSEFLDDWGVTQKIGEIRAILSEPFPQDVDQDGMDQLERALGETPHWRLHARKPTATDF